MRLLRPSLFVLVLSSAYVPDTQASAPAAASAYIKAQQDKVRAITALHPSFATKFLEVLPDFLTYDSLIGAKSVTTNPLPFLART